MIAIDEDNYKEAIEASFKVFAPPGISEFFIWNHLVDNYFLGSFCFWKLNKRDLIFIFYVMPEPFFHWVCTKGNMVSKGENAR